MAWVHDNASNIALANSPQFADWKSNHCFAHTLQLATAVAWPVAKLTRS